MEFNIDISCKKNIVLSTEISTMYKTYVLKHKNLSPTVFAGLLDFVIRINLKANYV